MIGGSQWQLPANSPSARGTSAPTTRAYGGGSPPCEVVGTAASERSVDLLCKAGEYAKYRFRYADGSGNVGQSEIDASNGATVSVQTTSGTAYVQCLESLDHHSLSSNGTVRFGIVYGIR